MTKTLAQFIANISFDCVVEHSGSRIVLLFPSNIQDVFRCDGDDESCLSKTDFEWTLTRQN